MKEISKFGVILSQANYGLLVSVGERVEAGQEVDFAGRRYTSKYPLFLCTATSFMPILLNSSFVTKAWVPAPSLQIIGEKEKAATFRPDLELTEAFINKD